MDQVIQLYNIKKIANLGSHFIPGSPGTPSVSSGDTLSLSVIGDTNDSATITIVNTTDSSTQLDISIGSVSESYYFVLTSSTTNGDIGGIAGGNQFCYDDLKNNDWMGKSNAYLTAQNVTAFLCDGTSCNNGLATTSYTFARSGNVSRGGDSFTTDASGFGPGNAENWSVNSKTGFSGEVWTGRDTSSANKWNGTQIHLIVVLGHDLHLLVFYGRNGIMDDTDDDRWSRSIGSCSENKRLLCFVASTNPTDRIPNAVDWVDFNGVSAGQTINGIDDSIILEIHASPNVGTPSVEYSIDSGSWISLGTSTYSEISISNSSTLAFRVDGNRNDAVDITVRNRSDASTLLDTVTGVVKGFNFFALTSSQMDGNYGGLSGADKMCLADLLASDWLGKSKALLDVSTVKAFLCDSSKCGELLPSSTYSFAQMGSATAGGKEFTTDASGLGPNNSDDWSTNDAFGSSKSYRTGMTATTSTAWDYDTGSDHCNNWSGTTGSVPGMAHQELQMQNRWRVGSTGGCSTNQYVICSVSEKVSLNDVVLML